MEAVILTTENGYICLSDNNRPLILDRHLGFIPYDGKIHGIIKQNSGNIKRAYREHIMDLPLTLAGENYDRKKVLKNFAKPIDFLLFAYENESEAVSILNEMNIKPLKNNSEHEKQVNQKN